MSNDYLLDKNINPRGFNIMNVIKILFQLVIISFASVSTLAYAENNEQVKAAIEQTVAKLEQAAAAVDKGEDAKAIVEMVLEAKQLQKPISTSDPKVSIKKAQGSNKLGQARTALNDGDLKNGGELVKDALADYKEVKEKYNATH
jgi:2,3-bisphosphoglycerate-independent phosphoglycerate mutase